MLPKLTEARKKNKRVFALDAVCEQLNEAHTAVCAAASAMNRLKEAAPDEASLKPLQELWLANGAGVGVEICNAADKVVGELETLYLDKTLAETPVC